MGMAVHQHVTLKLQVLLLVLYVTHPPMTVLPVKYAIAIIFCANLLVHVLRMQIATLALVKLVKLLILLPKHVIA